MIYFIIEDLSSYTFTDFISYSRFIGTVLGGILGNFINFEIKGIDFILTALFLVIFLSQWKQNRDHFPAIIGLLASVVAMLIFGKNFILPAMVIILFVLYVDYRRDKHD
ncbi:hypothetical protein B6K86_02910 [Lachnospiraceae bacterium]|nr:hypothetical protein B6K86_02910 [Lachnospiraceae bacterium]